MRRFVVLVAAVSAAHWIAQAMVMAATIPIVRPDRSGADVSELGRALGPLPSVLQLPLVWAFQGALFDFSPLLALTANSFFWGIAVASLVLGMRLLRKRRIGGVAGCQ